MKRTWRWIATALLGALAACSASCAYDGPVIMTGNYSGGSGGTGGVAGAGATTSADGGTGGTGATGGTGGSTGTAGTGGAMCDPATCPPPSNECVEAVCDLVGQCAEQAKPDGTAAVTQTGGDCKKNVCQGGAVASQDDDGDLPFDNNECTDDVCLAGAPMNPLVPVNTPCGAGGNLYCDRTGVCAGCVEASQCPGQDTECSVRECVAGDCGFDLAPQGQATAAQTASDCKKNQCDGMGSIESVADPADIENDGNPCTLDTCNGTVPAHSPVSANTPCGAGMKCDGAGECVGCITAADCQAPANPCLTATCVGGTCGTASKADGTGCNDGDACTQTDSCQGGTCTGENPVMCAALDQCHDAGTCNPGSGTCSNPPKADGTACILAGEDGTCQGGACAVCGNGTMEGSEQCDDSNTTPCDGCSPKCQLDASITYATAASLNLVIPDDGYNGTQASMACADITVGAAGDSIVDYVCATLSASHGAVGDLTVKLIGPTGTAVTLVSRPGFPEPADDGADGFGDSSNMNAAFPLTWKDGGPKNAEQMGNTLTSAQSVCQNDSACTYDPNSGSAAPGKLSAFIGQAGPGLWRLCIGDSGPGDSGAIDQVKLVLGQ